MFWSLRPTGRMPWIIREVKHHVYVKRQTPFCVPRYQVFSLLVFYCSLFLSCRSRGGEGGLAPLPLIFRPKWGPKGEEHFFETSPSPPPPFYLRVWMTGPALFWRSGSATVSTPKLQGSGNFFIHKSCLQLYLSAHFLFWRNSHLESDVCRLSYTWSLNSLFCVLGDFYASGRQGTEVREYLLILFLS